MTCCWKIWFCDASYSDCFPQFKFLNSGQAPAFQKIIGHSPYSGLRRQEFNVSESSGVTEASDSDVALWWLARDL